MTSTLCDTLSLSCRAHSVEDWSIQSVLNRGIARHFFLQLLDCTTSTACSKKYPMLYTTIFSTYLHSNFPTVERIKELSFLTSLVLVSFMSPLLCSFSQGIWIQFLCFGQAFHSLLLIIFIRSTAFRFLLCSLGPCRKRSTSVRLRVLWTLKMMVMIFYLIYLLLTF